MERNTITLAKYLFTKGVRSSLKIQKMLFFFHVEEKKHNKDFGFFKEKNNFQAWIYGPVNTDSFFEFQKYFNNLEEKDIFLLEKDEVQEIDKYYNEWFKKYNEYTGPDLVEWSHRNQSWLNARGDLDGDDICKTFMKEDKSFTTFND